MLKVSIIIITCNVEAYVSECIESAVRQTYDNLEIIVVDDGSKDETISIIKNYAEKYNNIIAVFKDNGGLVSARQAGIRKATGDYICFMDGDDWIEKDAIHNMVKNVQKSHYDIVMAGIIRDFGNYTRSDLNIIKKGEYDRAAIETSIIPQMIYNYEYKTCLVDPSLCNKLFKASVIVPVLLKVDPNIFYYGEDAATTFPCVLNSNSIYVTDYCYYHHRIVTVKKDVTYKNEKLLERLQSFHKNLSKSVQGFNEEWCLQAQVDGYYVHLLNKYTSGQLGVDLENMFSKSMVNEVHKQESNGELIYYMPPRGILDADGIILAGAGKVGKDYYRQLIKHGMHVVSWVDKNAKEIKEAENNKVDDYSVIRKVEYDRILVAAKRKQMADDIRRDLIVAGAEKEKIVWIEPIHIEYKTLDW